MRVEKGNMTNIKGAILDVDGTLIDSMWKWIEVEAEYLISLGIVPHRNLREALHTLNLLEAAEYFRTEYGIDKSAQKITDEKNSMMEVFYSEEAEMKAGVIPVLDALKARGIKMCVATATDRYLVEAALRRLGILNYFEKVFTCSEEKTSKTCPDIFLRAAEFLGTDITETIVVEDALHAIRAAKSAGFPIVAVYDLSAEYHQDEIKELCDHYYLNLGEMMAIL